MNVKISKKWVITHWLKKCANKKNKMKKLKKRNKKEKKVGNFRLSGSHLFLTYAKVDQEREVVLEQLKEKLLPRYILEYVISSEKHKDESNHIHVYLKLDGRCNICSKKRLDIRDENGEIVHGNYQSCRSFNNVISYVIKDGLENVLTNKDLDKRGREIDS